MELERMTQEELRTILKDTGHVLTVDDLAHVWTLNKLAHRVAHPADDSAWKLLTFPVRVGNALLLPPGVGAVTWVRERAFLWFSDDAEMFDIAIAFAMTRSRDPDELWAMSDGDEAETRIRKWAKGLTCTAEELRRGIEKIWPQDGLYSDWGPVVALLCREYGNTPHYWMWEATIPQIQIMLVDWEARRNAEMSYIAQQQAGRRGRAVAVSVSTAPKMANHARFVKYAKALRKRWSDGK